MQTIQLKWEELDAIVINQVNRAGVAQWNVIQREHGGMRHQAETLAVEDEKYQVSA